MNEAEIFQLVLDTIVKRYGLEIKRPTELDGYFDLYFEGERMGGMNPKGFSLLYNIGKLYEICAPTMF